MEHREPVASCAHCGLVPIASTARHETRLRSLADVEREHVLSVLEACAGSVGEAAKILEIGRNTLWRKLKAWS